MKPKHIKKPKDTSKKNFSCLVDEKLFREANTARKEPWPALLHKLFKQMKEGKI